MNGKQIYAVCKFCYAKPCFDEVDAFLQTSELYQYMCPVLTEGLLNRFDRGELHTDRLGHSDAPCLFFKVQQLQAQLRYQIKLH